MKLNSSYLKFYFTQYNYFISKIRLNEITFVWSSRFNDFVFLCVSPLIFKVKKIKTKAFKFFCVVVTFFVYSSPLDHLSKHFFLI